ncbi:hypothetical protein [Prevotella sp. P3-120]|uniref:hypothetical protein n=1 Tax=Prevotella sp. P3-120 TaxID=2024220 RepID=UPI00117C9797|nr:hypothetical protein [Prevotella sp. P3-120]
MNTVYTQGAQQRLHTSGYHNGTLLSQRSDMLDALPHKLQISLHSREGNNTDNPQQYIDEVITFAQEAARRGCIVVLRLWNEGDHNQMNDSILRMIAGYQPQPWTSRNDGWKLADNLLIENDNMFDWSDLQQKSYGDEEVLDFILRFLAMAELKRALCCSFGLTKTLDFILRFLAMAELKRALFCSFGLTKTFSTCMCFRYVYPLSFMVSFSSISFVMVSRS